MLRPLRGKGVAVCDLVRLTTATKSLGKQSEPASRCEDGDVGLCALRDRPVIPNLSPRCGMPVHLTRAETEYTRPPLGKVLFAQRSPGFGARHFLIRGMLSNIQRGTGNGYDHWNSQQ